MYHFVYTWLKTFTQPAVVMVVTNMRCGGASYKKGLVGLTEAWAKASLKIEDIWSEFHTFGFIGFYHDIRLFGSSFVSNGKAETSIHPSIHHKYMQHNRYTTGNYFNHLSLVRVKLKHLSSYLEQTWSSGGCVVRFLGKRESCENSRAPSHGECREQYRPKGFPTSSGERDATNLMRPTTVRM